MMQPELSVVIKQTPFSVKVETPALAVTAASLRYISRNFPNQHETRVCELLAPFPEANPRKIYATDYLSSFTKLIAVETLAFAFSTVRLIVASSSFFTSRHLNSSSILILMKR